MTLAARLLTAASALALACGPDPSTTESAGTTSTSTTGTASTASSTADTVDSASASSTGATSSTTDESSTGTTTTASTTSSTTDTSAGTTTSPDEPKAWPCGMQGGICVGAGTCEPAGGTVAAMSPAGCFFDDGDAECCVPPAPKPDAKTCADAGGLCAPIGGCLDAGGYLTAINDCEFQGVFACCVPHDYCGDATIECCDGQAVYNPTCDGGMFACPVGEPVPIGTCL